MTSIKRILVIPAALGVLSLGSCTKDFKSINTNPDALYATTAGIDYQNLGEPLNQAQLNILNYIDYNYQVQQNLNADIYSGYMMSADPFFTNNENNTNYFMIPAWNLTAWDIAYNNVMGPIATVLQSTVGQTKYAPFYAWAKLLRVEAMHRVTDIYGPIIYSHYGTTNADGSTSYDAQQDVYTAFFGELDSVVTTFTASKASGGDVAPFVNFDLVYGGSYSQWIKFANTLRLRLAIRVSNINPSLAQTEGEKSLSDPGGLLTDGVNDNAYVNLGTNENPIDLIAVAYQDINMNAALMSYMNGYHDPRISSYAQTATDPAVVGKYQGIRQGINIDAYSRYGAYSLPVNFPNKMLLMTAAEAWFLKSEAAIRGWAGAGDAGTDYNTGIQTSMNQYAVSSSAAGAYAADNSSTEAPYTDPKSITAGQNDVTSGPNLSTITIAWNDADAFQTKLQRIITQKWIAMYPEGQEAWSEFRRTLFPTLFPVVVNYSGGTISTSKFIRRLPFAADENSTNAAGVAGAITLLGGPDNGGTRLWWDTNPQ
jgi:hypothetical protein